MSGQNKPKTKYFLGIVIPSPFKESIESLKHELLRDHNLKGALRSPPHITLHRPFEWPLSKEERLLDTLEKFEQPASFNIQLLNFGSFAPRVIYVDVKAPELTALQQHLGTFARKHLGLLNEVEDLRGFYPHVTIAFRDLKKPKFYELQPQFMGKNFSADFPYTGFSILKLDKVWQILRTFPA